MRLKLCLGNELEKETLNELLVSVTNGSWKFLEIPKRLKYEKILQKPRMEERVSVVRTLKESLSFKFWGEIFGKDVPTAWKTEVIEKVI